mgnify:CR=1 FL=1
MTGTCYFCGAEGESYQEQIFDHIFEALICEKCDRFSALTQYGEWVNIEDYELVIDKKCQEWLNDGEYERYLRPSTLFGPKFGQYHGQKWTGTPGQRDWSKKHGGSY